jgi:transcriptional regulator with XRE-family HTH domain
VINAQRRDAICAEIARLMGEERKRLKLSKNKVAYLTGLNQSTVSRLENHHENPTMDSLLRVADVLKINLGIVIKQAISNVENDLKFSRKLAAKAKKSSP